MGPERSHFRAVQGCVKAFSSPLDFPPLSSTSPARGRIGDLLRQFVLRKTVSLRPETRALFLLGRKDRLSSLVSASSPASRFSSTLRYACPATSSRAPLFRPSSRRRGGDSSSPCRTRVATKEMRTDAARKLAGNGRVETERLNFFSFCPRERCSSCGSRKTENFSRFGKTQNLIPASSPKSFSTPATPSDRNHRGAMFPFFSLGCSCRHVPSFLHAAILRTLSVSSVRTSPALSQRRPSRHLHLPAGRRGESQDSSHVSSSLQLIPFPHRRSSVSFSQVTCSSSSSFVTPLVPFPTFSSSSSSRLSTRPPLSSGSLAVSLCPCVSRSSSSVCSHSASPSRAMTFSLASSLAEPPRFSSPLSPGGPLPHRACSPPFLLSAVRTKMVKSASYRRPSRASPTGQARKPHIGVKRLSAEYVWPGVVLVKQRKIVAFGVETKRRNRHFKIYPGENVKVTKTTNLVALAHGRVKYTHDVSRDVLVVNVLPERREELLREDLWRYRTEHVRSMEENRHICFLRMKAVRMFGKPLVNPPTKPPLRPHHFTKQDIWENPTLPDVPQYDDDV